MRVYFTLYFGLQAIHRLRFYRIVRNQEDQNNKRLGGWQRIARDLPILSWP